MAVGSIDAALPSGTVTFLRTDVAGSTPLWETDEVAMAAAMARHDVLLGRAVVGHGGAHPLEQGEGDSMVAVFAAPGDAIGAAVDAQRWLRAEPWPDGMEVRVRMALHTGDAMPGADGRTYQGTAIIRCARLRGLAHGGQVLLSSTTAALSSASLPEGVSLRELGVHALKGLRRPEVVWQLMHPSLPDSFPPLVATEATRPNVPLTLTTFFGQEQVMSDVEHRLELGRIVTLTGAGGCGKTRLANEVAQRAASRYIGGVRWVELAAVSSGDEVVECVAGALDVSVEPGRLLLDSIMDHVTRVSGDVLLVVDNCEHLVASVASVVDRIVHASATVRVLSTSREPLGIGGEAVIRVPSLDATGAATDLFLDRAEAVRPRLTVNPTERTVIEAICSRVDGIPLAIELAAARLRTMSLHRLAGGLDDAFRVLIGGSRTGSQRHQAMQACVAWSVDQLDDVEHVVLRRLAALVGKFTLEAAMGVCTGDAIDPNDALDAIDASSTRASSDSIPRPAATSCSRSCANTAS